MTAADPMLDVLGGLLEDSVLSSPDELPLVVGEAGEKLGWDVTIYLIDYSQRVLVPHQAPTTPDPREEQVVESTLAGRAYRTTTAMAGVAPDGRPNVWVPLVDGVERLGVLDFRLAAGDDPDEASTELRIRWFAHLTGHLVASRSQYGDTHHRLRSTQPRTVASELIWSLLPPLTVACEGLVISGILEPAYAVAGDVFDYSIDDGLADVGVVDATGHDLSSGVIGAVVLAAYRNGRRLDHDLVEIMRRIDASLSELGPDTYATGLLATLDRTTGTLTYLNVGHPAPMILRDGRIVRMLDSGRRTLFGLEPRGAVEPATERLQPGDWIVLYTDGVVEARDEARTFYGIDRFVDTIERCASEGQPAPETLRRIVHEVLGHQHGVLQDDATILLIQWETAKELDMFATSSPQGGDRSV